MYRVCMKKIMIALSLFVLSFAHAGTFSDYYSYCVLKKDGKFDYSIGQVSDMNRSLYTPVGLIDDTSLHAVAGAIRGSTRLYDEARNLISFIGTGEFIQGKQVRERTIRSIKSQIRIHRLNAFEKASLVNCAVFTLIRYRMNMTTKLGSILKIYEKGEGICTEMTAVAKDLGDAVGLKVRSMVSKEDHNWPEYKLEGRWYILDPTANGFNFKEALKQ